MRSVQRLCGRSRFAAVRAGGVSGRGGRLRVFVMANGEQYSRAAVAVTGARGAVERNRARRRLRAAAASLLQGHPGYDVVVHARRDPSEEPYEAVLKSLAAAVAQAQARLGA